MKSSASPDMSPTVSHGCVRPIRAATELSARRRSVEHLKSAQPALQNPRQLGRRVSDSTDLIQHAVECPAWSDGGLSEIERLPGRKPFWAAPEPRRAKASESSYSPTRACQEGSHNPAMQD